MFTGIVQGTAQIKAITEKANFRTHIVEMPQEMLKGLQIGASVAHNGVCLTVTEIKDNLVSFDLMQETLKITNLGELNVGDPVNIERAMQMGTEIGGHILSGHVYCTAEIIERLPSENNLQIWFKLPTKEVMKYVLTKGFIAVDGISLTIGEVREQRFCVNLIPETLHRTLIGKKAVGDKVNIEIDPQTQAIVDTVERYLAQKEA
ncbi:riboflavin synthase, alpha subunit [Aggregatibacter actinomycetemcomitans serotype e str. SC1083]|uniref:Riboflavin synthase n=1 Tax=Aggregatibacter actinomycetemcomitans serotype e str. SC1083 TaxID=907488 RepID=G4AAG8_AGGAC|nr:riboflavin synthase [Aggregatibacter actinomycetemcomitans]EGY32825.1 riboflavin synthase, alpha subunit [Aggregatibacter actinomycetemcomitans serotype e str. SC1083]KYK72322.1 riboflavin synthase subunit alpha [Aggregatibacter actinomycetemcomitans serotype e str. SA3096]KYK80093.1 riboflavin synthase subunit alpha [Aggregatibacter actinomycetemcomitans serotype e str. SC936]KYK95133.1 riboflavin synthase subunit alpha [Aggregatibacter actinomycetemcomitans serotype e str. ANH9776]TYB2185